MLLLCTLLVQLIADKSFISIVKDGKRKIHRKKPDPTPVSRCSPEGAERLNDLFYVH
jgi:hypothetical protein